MVDNKKTVTTYSSERQKHYYEEILPKLSENIQAMDLGMRANTVLVNAGLCDVKALRQAIAIKQHIPYLDPEDLKYIKSCLKVE